MTRSVTGDSLERDKHLINCSPTRASFGECRFPQHKRRRCPCSSVIVTGDGSCSKAFFLFHIDEIAGPHTVKANVPTKPSHGGLNS
uniref:Uncharacterized protein n=1 Tax=Magallana gigas TaxID=29159 RepID=K1RKM0_MAGGI